MTPRIVAITIMFGVSSIVMPAAARAQRCSAGCMAETKACILTNRVALLACKQGCRDAGPSAAVRSCRGGCKTSFRSAKVVCLTDRAGCVDACSPPPAPSSCDGAFLDSCGRQLATCARGVVATAKGCVEGCGTATDRLPCLQACAETARMDNARCASGFADCIVPCRPPTTTTTTLPSGCTMDADCDDGNPCTADRCVGGTCDHACLCVDAAGATTCCPGPAASCTRPCGLDASRTCGGTCPTGATCEAASGNTVSCGCVSGLGGPCGGNIFAPPPTCAPGLVCKQSNPDATGTCVEGTCIPFFATGCTQTSDCCDPCSVLGRAPCAVCLEGQCVGTP
jgi:hypothetical protein